jgi:hypothetical protein
VGFGEKTALRERSLGVGLRGTIGIWQNGFWFRGDFRVLGRAGEWEKKFVAAIGDATMSEKCDDCSD